MPNINITPEDWQQVALGYAQENINLKVQLAAALRELNAVEPEQASSNGTPAEATKKVETK